MSATHSIEQCSLSLDLEESISVNIHKGLFGIDKLNSGSLPNVQISTTIENCVYINNGTNFSLVTNFTKRDIDQGNIWYIVKDKKTRVSKQQFGLNFFIGHAKPVHIQFQVCLNLLPYPQLDRKASDLNVSLPKGGDIEINSSVLFSTDTGNQTTLWYELLVPPAHGELITQFKDPAIMFTQQDVNAGKIYYNNHNYSRYGDKFVLTLSNRYYDRTESITISVSIFLLNLEVVNTGFTVKEGGSHTIDSNELYATGPEKKSIMFHINVKPIYGKIVFKNDLNQTVSSFSRDHITKGQVVYINDGQEFNRDTMTITIEAVGSNETPSHINDTAYFGTVHISVELVNDNPPRVWNVSEELTIVDGDSFIFTLDMLSFQDDDSDMDIGQLKYTVSYGPMRGHLFFGPNKTIITEFLQQDIRDMQIGYQNSKSSVANGDRNLEICGLTIFDGVHSVPFFFTFNITSFAIEPKNNKKLSLDEGEDKVLSDKNLFFVAAKAKPPVNDSEYIYEIISQPIHGQLVMRNSCNCFFTQEELRNGSVIYSHDDSDTTNDNFTFVVTVRGFKAAVMTFFIDINPVDDQSPSVTYLDMLIVHFDEAVYFNKSVLEATDSEAELSDLVFTLLEKPLFGSIKRQKTGPRDTIFPVPQFTQLHVNEEAIFYQHEIEEDGKWIDKVVLSLSDGKNVYNKYIEITFVLIPRQLPIRVHGIKLHEGQIVPLAPHNFEVTHPYLSKLEFYIDVTKTVEYGKLLLLYQYPTRNFNSTELKNSTILYFNGEDNEKIEDTFKFVARAGGISSEEQTFVFTIESTNDEHPVIVYNSIISLWAGEVKSISKDDLYTNDSDAYPADKLEYIIIANTSYGHFAYRGAHQTAITKFSQDDIVAGIVVFRSFRTVDDTEIEINFNVTDGVHNVTSYITFEINVLKIKVSPLHITVAMGAAQLISFSPDINDDSEERLLYYHLQSAGDYGVILNTVTGLEVTYFTQEQIESQQIVYKHTAVDRYETSDTVYFNVSTDLAKTVKVSLNVTIILKSSSNSYLAASEPLAVDEGGIVCLNESILDASNVLYEVYKSSNLSIALHELTIQYIITYQPSAGELKSGNASIDNYFEHSDMKSPNGICYHHNDSETTSDHFSIKINILYNSTDVWYSNSTEVPIQIEIRPVNDEHPEIEFVDKKCVYKFENYTAVIHQKDLYIYDKDTVAEELVIVISNQSGVECTVGDVPTHNFTQDDINNEKIKCMLPRSLDSSNLTFYFTDGNFISDNKSVYYSKIVITLSIAHIVSKLNYPQEKGLSGVTLTDNYLNSSTTGHRSDTVYTVTASPVNGNVFRLNRTVDNFTQMDIDNGMIQYKATNKASYNDTFTMRVTNREATPQHVTLHVSAMAMIDSNNVTIVLSSLNQSQSLPRTLFNTTTLVNLSNPTFTVLNKLSYGHFDLDVSSVKRSSELFSFDSIQLRELKVLYTLDEENIANGTEVLQLSIKPDDMQAGFKEVFFSFSVLPSMPTLTPSPTIPPVDPNQSSSQKGSSFTLVALVPIIGVPSFILTVVIILVGFWYSQKLKEKKRCAAAQGSSAICMKTPAFRFPTAYHTNIATDVDTYSERQNSDHLSNNSDEGISMALPLEDQIEDEGVTQRYGDDGFQSRSDYNTQYHHHHYPLTSVYTASGYNTPIPQHTQQLPILKNEEYWI